MSELKVALVDDDIDFLNMLKTAILHYLPQLVIDLYEETNPAFYKQTYDVYFLDIDMKEHGLLVAQRLRELKGDHVRLIFVTSYGNLSSEGYRFKAFWFIEKERWEQVLPEVLLALQSELMKHMIAIKNIDKKLVFLELNELLSITAFGNQVMIKTTKEEYLTYSSVKKFQEKLPASIFYKIQSGTMINRNNICSYDRKTGELILCQGDKFFVSRRLRTPLYQALMIDNEVDQ